MTLFGGRTYVFMFDPLSISVLNVAKHFCFEKGLDFQVTPENILVCTSQVFDFLKSQIKSLDLPNTDQFAPDLIDVFSHT